MEENIGTETTSSVKISDDAIASIAALAATDIDGVASMAGNITNELIAKLGVKNLSKGVKISLGEDDTVSVDLSLIVTYGSVIPAVCRKVHDKVKSQVENMTGLRVTEINIHVAGVDAGKTV